MTIRTTAGLAAVVLGVWALSSAAEAAPAAGLGSAPAANVDTSIRHLAGGCHGYPEFHYSDRYGRRIWHYHFGRRCRDQRADPPRGEHGYRDSRRHSGRESRFDHHSGRESRHGRRGDCVRVGPVTVCD